MSQTKVTSFYVTRRSARNQSNKVAGIESIKNPVVVKDVIAKSVSQQLKKEKRNEVPEEITVTKTKEPSVKNITVNKSNSKSRVVKQKATKRATKASKKEQVDSSQSKVTSFYETQKTSKDSNLDTIIEDSIQSPIPDCPTTASKNEEISKKPECLSSFEANLGFKGEEEKIKLVKSKEPKILNEDILRSPKRNLSNPNEGTPPKKLLREVDLEKIQSPSKVLTPKKLFDEEKIVKMSNEKTSENKLDETPKNKIKIKNQSEYSKKAREIFESKCALLRNYTANSFKATSIISPTQRQVKKSVIPEVPENQKIRYLYDPEITSLILPSKYKLLSEMFRSMDIVVCIRHNRKEKVTFEKVKDGIQQMMKRDFSLVNLRQIMTVMPSAYDVTLEKCAFKKAGDPDYQYIINPKLYAAEGKSKSYQFVTMSPQDCSEREKEFNYLLINLVKQHHQVFLSRLNFPSVHADKIKRWHPKFAVDSVPDIEAAPLPEAPETEVKRAKDVLKDVLKSTFCGKDKVGKALKSVADVSISTEKMIEPTPNPNEQKPVKTKNYLKGVDPDLLAKIRAREATKFLDRMTESPSEVKRKAMLERLPEMIRILWLHFVSERKSSIPIDSAIEKIIHSCGSLSTHEEVYAHINLIAETFKGWLTFVQMPKRLYITINRSKNIEEMLDNFPH